MADWSITKAQYERNCFSKPLLNGRYEFILNRYAWREYDWMPLSLKSIFYNTSGSFHDNNEPLYSCLETWMTRAAHSQRGGSIWLWLECMEQEYLVNPQTTGFVLGEKTSLGTRKCTFVRFKEARLIKDFKKMSTDPPQGISATPLENNIMEWNAVIFGPEDTPWEGGTFKLSISFNEDYPNKPPKVKFLTKMFHPNIYNDGQICLDILQNQWSPIYDVAAILTSIQSLLTDPNPNSPANSEAARLYTENRKLYERRVKEMVEVSWQDEDE